MAVAANEMIATPMLHRLKSRSEKITSGISGSRTLTDCQNTNTVTNPTPATISAQIQGCQCAAWPCCSPNTISNMPTPDNPTPTRSKRCDWVGSTGTSQYARTSPSTPIGTLTKKIHCHPSPSTSTPPASGPARLAAPAVALHTLTATPRRSAGKIRVIVDNVCGVITPAPTPWTTRAAISMAALPASPHHTDATVNTARPIRYRFLVPNRSPRRPATNSTTAYPSR